MKSIIKLLGIVFDKVKEILYFYKSLNINKLIGGVNEVYNILSMLPESKIFKWPKM